MISSKDNQLIKEIRKLREKKYRVQSQQFIIEGFRFFEEALKSNSNIDKVFIEEKSLNKLKELYKTYNINDNIETYVVSYSVLKSISNTENPQGIVAVINYFKKESLNLQGGFYILVDKVQDPGNMGTIIRTGHAAGALGIIITKGTVDIYNEKTLRSTMGSIFYIPIIEDDNLNVVKSLQQNGFKLLVSSLDTNSNFYDVNMTENIIIAVGNEGNGISEDLNDISDIKVKIPMPGLAESLNVAVACSIMTFERIRQINTK
ncbi:RNA methyltransferase [Clostridium sporogenes]|uniref:RNA methyltransferase n=1 Tax=Clostridium botulinum TaxID=1491 RepID=A0A6M0SXI6_CLOBO|nr:RNA methyltransferase [Clostridium sporogenes]NFA59410.1 RNA methyltransferase [Clostridium botulinum]NFI75282.1 RNA methyltransferase [Clostridium sporogenes]NFL72144.1 RNA methyltransferase [Clostridium sporogenes]NFM24199.1 RNA methyltransferase [Clostridium sporogenes]NFP63175.1 RNA methyltransferase [Clostridium sporogenes]